MAVLSELILYPIKSCAGMPVLQATLTHAGLSVDSVYDREWMVVDAQGTYLTQREHPRLALVTPRLRSEVLELRAPGMLRLDIPLGLPDPDEERTIDVAIWDERLRAYDCDDVTAAWFSAFLGIPCRLVRFHPNAARFANTKWTGGIEAPTLFSDGYPVLAIGSASLADLNEKLTAAGRAPLPMNRFRPNIVIDQLDAYEEDYVDAFTLGAATLKPVKPCPRCPIPSVDQDSGVVGPDPLDILLTYRTKPALDGAPCFGMNCIVTAGDGEQLVVGQQIGVSIAF